MPLNAEIVQQIREIAAGYESIEKIVLFGSRARNEHHKTSDVDLAVYGEADLHSFIYDLENKVSTLLMFDISNMEEVKDDFFIEQVEKDGVVIYEKPGF